MHCEVERRVFAVDDKYRLQECCRWSLHHAFEKALAKRGDVYVEQKDRPACRYGRSCYRMNPEHLLDYYHHEENQSSIKGADPSSRKKRARRAEKAKHAKRAKRLDSERVEHTDRTKLIDDTDDSERYKDE